MKNTKLITGIIIFFSIQLISCFEENDNTGPPDPKYFSRQIAEVVSPQKTRAVKIYESGNSNDSSTQILVSFGWPQEKGGGGVFHAKGINLDIKVNWINEDNVMVKYKSSLKVYPLIDSSVQLFSEKVKIHYIVVKD